MSERHETIGVVRGILGWSNDRNGCEFYRDGEPQARWDRSTERGTSGALLVDVIDPRMDMEGSRLIVVVVPRRLADKADDIEKRVRKAVSA